MDLIEPEITWKLVNHNEYWLETEGLIMHKGQIYVPNDRNLCGKVIVSNHDSPQAGHPGIDWTQELLSQDFFWIRMNKDIQTFVKECKTCQQIKPR
jgi:hypothetical protein